MVLPTTVHMAFWNNTVRPVVYANGDNNTPPKTGYFNLRIKCVSGEVTFNGETIPVGGVLTLAAPSGRTLTAPEIGGSGTYTWHGMR